MAAPLYNLIKGTTGGTPGTGAFTPNAASAGFLAWSTIYTGWMGMVRYEDGSAWELAYSYWNGTTLSRASTQVRNSSTGSQLSLTSAATAAMIIDADVVQPNLGMRTGFIQASGGAGSISTQNTLGIGSPTVLGTGTGGSLATTNYLTEQVRMQYTSLTTANAQAGIYDPNSQCLYSTAAGRGGYEMTMRFGCSQLPTGPRLFIGLSSSAFNAQTIEPSAYTQSFSILGLDSTDTNLQFMTNDAGTPAGKTDTGIPLAANGWYEFWHWVPPGGGRVYMRLYRLDTGAIFYAERTTDLPANGQFMKYNVIGGLNGTNTGTAIILNFQSLMLRAGE